MEDRFKFRVWHRNGQMGIYEDDPGDAFKWFNEGQPVVIEQCTGLKDRNANLIYEGDILGLYDKKFRVRWSRSGACWMAGGGAGAVYLYFALDLDAIHIGNIHEKPELEAK